MWCGQCGSDNPEGTRSCGQCGHSFLPAQRVTGNPSGATPARQPAAGRDISSPNDERRLVTIMFADLAGFTPLAERLDPEEVQDLLNSCFDVLVPCVERYGGTIDKFIGDALMALFGAPVAHEHDPERAIRAALDLRRALEEFNRELGLALALHIGINTGRVLAGSVGGGGRQDYSVVGDAVNLAARLEELSQPNEILIGPQTYQAAGHLFETEEGETIRVRGRSEETKTYRVLGKKDSAQSQVLGRLRAPLVGREKELRVLTAALDRLSRGRGGVLYVLGEAGLGKSRLVAESRKSVPARDLAWRECQTVSMGQNPSYGPIRQILEADAGFTTDDDPAARYKKLSQRLDLLLPEEHDRQLTALAALLSLPSEAEARGWLSSLEENVFGERLHGAMSQYLERLACERPLVLVWEDIHWLDASSAALIDKLLALADTSPLLFLLVARPELEGSLLDPERLRPRVGSHYEELHLAPLTREESRFLVAELLGSRELAAGLQPAIQKRAEGNPFYIQEILRSLIDQGGIETDGRGGWQFARTLGLTIPDTLQGVITSRVDRLPEEEKQSLRLASVVGRTFSQPLLAGVTGLSPARLGRQLRCLEDMELIQTVRRRPEPEYAFTHALVQEAVYESMLLKERRVLHGKVAEEIESRFAASLVDHYGLLAYHYAAAENWDQARDYLLKAGDQATNLGAGEASGYYQQALEGLLRGCDLRSGEDDATQAIDWFLDGVGAFYKATRLAGICPALEAFHARATQAFGPTDRRTLAVAEMVGAAYAEQYMLPEARAMLESTLRAREALGDKDDPSLARPLRLLAIVAVNQGGYEEAEDLLTRGLALQMACSRRDYDMLTEIYLGLLYVHHYAGRLQRATEVANEALSVRELEGTQQYPILLANICDLKMRLGHLEEAEAHARLGIQSARLPYVETCCRANLGEVLICEGRYQDALQELEQAAEVIDGLSRSVDLGGILGPLAECQLQLGHLEAAEESTRRALNLLEKEPGVDRAYAAWAWQVMSGIELVRGDLEEAERSLEKATSWLTYAYPDGERFLEAELLFRRAQLRLKQGQAQESREDFARALGLLTELGGEEHERKKVMQAQWERLVLSP